jgi:hypothetical protein
MERGIDPGVVLARVCSEAFHDKADICELCDDLWVIWFF